MPPSFSILRRLRLDILHEVFLTGIMEQVSHPISKPFFHHVEKQTHALIEMPFK